MLFGLCFYTVKKYPDKSRDILISVYLKIIFVLLKVNGSYFPFSFI